MKISNSQRYIEDVNRFAKAINSIEDPMQKRKYQSMLADFKNEIQLIDDAHSTLNPDPLAAREKVKKSLELRRDLDSMIKSLSNNT